MTEPHLAFFGSSTAMDGGSELCLLRMAKHFREKYPVTLFLPDEGPLFDASVNAGIDTLSLNFLRLRRHRGLEWVEWWNRMRKARKKLAEECRARGISLIHFNDFIDLPFFGVTNDLAISSVAHLRLIVGSEWVRKIYRSRVLRSGSFVVPVSQAVSNQMLGSHSRIPFRVVYDPAPAAEHFFPKRETRYNHPFRIVMVSKLLENKGHLNFCHVAQQLEKKHPGNYSFTMVAPPSPGRESYGHHVQIEIDKLPEERCQMIPGASHSELGEILRSSDLLLHLPDTQDSFPGVVLESMACGTPVLGYRTGGIPEQLGGGTTGILVDPGNFALIVSEIEAISHSPDDWRMLAESGMKKVSTDFSAETHFQSLDSVYRELLRV